MVSADHSILKEIKITDIKVGQRHRKDMGDLTTLAGQWDAKEKAAFQEAVQALSRTPATQLARVNFPLEDDN